MRRRSIDCINDGRHGGPIILIEAERLDDGWMLEPVIEVICHVCAVGGSELELEMLIKMRKASHVWFKDQENSLVNSSRLECKPSQARRIWTFRETLCL